MPREDQDRKSRKAVAAAGAVLAAIVLVVSSCAVKSRSLRLEELEAIQGLSGPAVQADLEALDARVNGLWTELSRQKLTAYLTKQKIAPYFQDQDDLSEFIAIYASLFRNLSFRREIVQSYSVNDIVLEQNGVIARVDITIRGTIYFLWRARIHENQQWIKARGQWYLVPEAYGD